MNRLADETSPYLQQHKDNPVDWYPWGDEAFERAKAEDKPILLSVGYAACHWCHVMAHESFEEDATAEVMNDLFVNVKVDREERPDVDAIYMEAVQALSGHGGWPMTVFLTPDGRPFFGGTYFPKTARQGLPSFVQLCEAMSEVWKERRDDVLSQASELTAALGRSGQVASTGEPLPGPDAIMTARNTLLGQFDNRWGGFGRAPKFPQPDLLELLLRAYLRDGSDDTLGMVTVTLDAMAAGGMYDHLGGGFARYSTDTQWLVPHFEKMLTDQGLLVDVYLHAWQVTGEDRFLQVLSETIEYVRRDLRHPDGGFYSSEDADSEGVEGKFYVWSEEEIRSLLGSSADEAIEWWGVTPGGNFEGANILYRPVRGSLKRSDGVEAARRTLFDAREKRVRPGLDDKVLTEWNGLFIAALAQAGAALGREDWLADARAGATFLLENLRRPDGRWLRAWQGGNPGRHLAFAADYAAVVDAFTRLAEATGEARWIEEARTAADAMLELFWDDGAGGLFTNGSDAETLIIRGKDLIDNAVPSANGHGAQVLVRLGALVGEGYYTQRGEDILGLLAGLVRQHPTAFSRALAAVDMVSAGVTEIAVIGELPELVRAVQRGYLPNAVLAWGEPYPSPLFEDRKDGLAYVCRDYACQAPVADVDSLLAQLSGDPR
ncbi:MAG TPA: thioredoxin domain-containing protein [Acidimicrobiales bacterium]|nr:thioredoxin domain-containing protein [Acidimicrobiales bacterium]